MNPEENEKQDQTGVKDISIGLKGAGEDVEGIELQIKPKRKVSTGMIAGLIGLVLLTIGAAVVALNFESISGDIRQRADSTPTVCTSLGQCLNLRRCTQADVDAHRQPTGASCGLQDYCSSTQMAYCRDRGGCVPTDGGGHCASSVQVSTVCSQWNINICGGNGTCNSWEARKCNFNGTGWDTGCFADSRCGTPPSTSTGTTTGTQTGGGGTSTGGTTSGDTLTSNFGTGGGGTATNLCSTEAVNMTWTDKAGIIHTAGSTNVPFNPTERFYASNCRANATGWDLLLATDTGFTNVVFSITNASGKDPNLVSSYVDAELNRTYNTLYMTCRKAGNTCGSIQLVRGATAATPPAPICGNNICETGETCENGALKPTYSGSGDPGSWQCLSTDTGKYPSGPATGACRYPGSPFGAPYCAQTPTGTPTPIASPTPVAMCVGVKAWVLAPGQGCLPTVGGTGACVAGDWKETPFNQLGSVAKVGDTIRFTVAGSNATFTKARFSINGNTPTESTTRYGSDYYWDYVLTNGGNFSITAELFK